MKRAHVYVTGRVQDVFFRANTCKTAEKLGITGWVRNLPDGRVEAVFEGSGPAMDEMLAWCRTGTPPARVDDLNIIDEAYTGKFKKFKIVE